MTTERIDVLAVMCGRLLCRIGIHRYRWVVWLSAYDINVCTRCDKTNPNQSA